MTHSTLEHIPPFEVPANAPLSFRIFGPVEPNPAVAGHRPILALDCGGRTPVVIDGHDRMMAAYRSGEGSVPVVLYRSDTPRETVCSLSLNPAVPRSAVERLVAVYKSVHFYRNGPEKIAVPLEKVPFDEVPPELDALHTGFFGRRVSGAFLLRLFEILTGSADELEGLHRSSNTLEQIVPLLDLNVKERRAVIGLRARCDFTAAQTKKLSRLLLFARGRKDFDVEQWADAVTARGRPEGTSILGSLRRVLRPETTRQESAIAAVIKRMKLPGSIHIKAPENLEGDSFSCYFRFSRADEFTRYLEVLANAFEDGCVDDLLRILNEEVSDKDSE